MGRRDNPRFDRRRRIAGRSCSVPGFPLVKITQKALAIAGLVVLLGAAYWVQNRSDGAKSSAAEPGASGATAGGASGAAGGGGSGTGAGAGGSGGSGRRGEGGPAPVEVAKVEQRRLEDEVHAVGSMRSNQSVMLRPEVSGRIQSLNFRDGQRVRKGELMVQLDDSLQQAQLAQARAQAGIAATNLQRSRDLAAQNFLSPSAVDQAAAALAVAEAQVRLAEAQVARMRIVAPFDALAGIRTVNVGDYVKDGADLVGLEDNSRMWLDFRLPERVLGRLKPGASIEAELDALPGKSFKGQVEAVDSQIDANGRALLVRARMANPGQVLKSGMFARVRTVMGVRENALVVPEEALVPLGNKQYVFKIEPAEKGQQARRIEIKVGMRLPGVVEILGEVKPGDSVVTAGQSRLGRGDAPAPVKLVDLNRPAGPRGAASGASGSARAASGSVAVEAAKVP